jgi:hypothetical protein
MPSNANKPSLVRNKVYFGEPDSNISKKFYEIIHNSNLTENEKDKKLIELYNDTESDTRLAEFEKLHGIKGGRKTNRRRSNRRRSNRRKTNRRR